MIRPKRFITLFGNEVRIEFNFNALAEFCEVFGLAYVDIDNVSAFSPKKVRAFIFQALAEGARLEDKKLDFDETKLGEVLFADEIGECMKIYVEQSRPNIKKKEDKPTKEVEK